MRQILYFHTRHRVVSILSAFAVAQIILFFVSFQSSYGRLTGYAYDEGSLDVAITSERIKLLHTKSGES